jgi:hypothetical protein
MGSGSRRAISAGERGDEGATLSEGADSVDVASRVTTGAGCISKETVFVRGKDVGSAVKKLENASRNAEKRKNISRDLLEYIKDMRLGSVLEATRECGHEPVRPIPYGLA